MATEKYKAGFDLDQTVLPAAPRYRYRVDRR
jgi:hypothetical protein